MTSCPAEIVYCKHMDNNECISHLTHESSWLLRTYDRFMTMNDYIPTLVEGKLQHHVSFGRCQRLFPLKGPAYHHSYFTRSFYQGYICTSKSLYHGSIEYMFFNVIWYCVVLSVLEIFLKILPKSGSEKCHRHFLNEKLWRYIPFGKRLRNIIDVWTTSDGTIRSVFVAPVDLFVLLYMIKPIRISLYVLAHMGNWLISFLERLFSISSQNCRILHITYLWHYPFLFSPFFPLSLSLHFSFHFLNVYPRVHLSGIKNVLFSNIQSLFAQQSRDL